MPLGGLILAPIIIAITLILPFWFLYKDLEKEEKNKGEKNDE